MIYVSNHPSLLDVPLILIKLYPTKPLIFAGEWAYKRFFWLGRVLGCPIVESNLKGIFSAKKWINNSGSVLMFPEATLSPKFEGDYKWGFIKLAQWTFTNIIFIKRKKFKTTLSPITDYNNSNLKWNFLAWSIF